MKKINDSGKAFLLKLQTLYDIEKELEKALPKLAKAAEDPDLKEGFETHLEETKKHSQRLEQAFELLDEKPKKLKSEGIRGIVADGSWVIKETHAPEALSDAMLASAARYAEHYEMAGYMNAIKQAQALGLTEIEELLRETLAEEEAADEKLEMALQQNLQMA